MKSSKLQQMVLIPITILSVMGALITPAPAYAQGSAPGEPPPPGVPVNDLGRPKSPETDPAGATSSGADASQPPPVISSRVPAATADPVVSGPAMFCPEGVSFGGPKCQYQATIEDALAYAQGLINGSGTIFVQDTYLSLTTTLQVDQTLFTGVKPVYLNMLGGITDMTSGAYALGSTFTTLGQNIAIQNFTGGDPVSHGGASLSLTDFILNVDAPTGIFVDKSEHILLNYVRVNQGGSVAGISVTTSSDVTIKNTEVNTTGNGAGILASSVTGLNLDTVNVRADLDDGLKIAASSGIALSNVSSTSKARGAFLSNNTGDLSIIQSQFNNNVSSGLVISHQGKEVLDHVTASGNGGSGVVIDNRPVNGSGDITLEHSIFNNNLFDGVFISGQGEISLVSVYGSFNGFYGAYLDNCLFDSVLNACTGSNNLSVTGNTGSDLSVFAQNGEGAGWHGNTADGLYARTAGELWVDHTQALANPFGSGANLLAEGDTKTLTVSDSLFMSNGMSFPGAGLSAASTNRITLSAIISNQNGASGVELHATGDVGVTDGDFSENGIASLSGGGLVGGNGIEIFSLGNVILDTINTLNNQAGIVLNSGNGVFVENCIDTGSGCLGSGRVQASDLNTAGNSMDGLQVTSGGDVLLEHICTIYETSLAVITGNGGGGANLLTQATDSVSVADSLFNGNAGDGVHIETPGSISLSNVAAENNGGNGAYLNNCLDLGDGCTGIGSVIVTGADTSNPSVFSTNAADGLFVASAAGITLNYIEAVWNGNNGAMLDNCTDLGSGCTMSGDISIQNSVFTNNLLGLQVSAGRIASLVSVHADQNSGAGADLLGGVGVEIDDSSFNLNEDYGVNAEAASGGIFLNRVDASNNASFGAKLTASSPAGRTGIARSTFNDNGAYGLYIIARGKVTLNLVTASHNVEFGTQVDCLGLVDVTDSTFNSNQGTGTGGLGIFTDDDISLNNVTADYNAGDGVFLSSNKGQVQVNNSQFNHNDRFGLELMADKQTTLVNVTACRDKLGPVKLWGGGLIGDKFNICNENNASGLLPVELPTYPWQIIKVYKDVGKGSGTLSNWSGTIFLYLEKQPGGQPDKELGRAVLPPGIVAEGTLATFEALADGGLLAALPSGDAFLAPGFNLSFTAPDGSAIDGLAGTLTVKFSLPDGFSLPTGKKLVILFYDSAGSVALKTYSAGGVVYAFATRPGSFGLALIPATP